MKTSLGPREIPFGPPCIRGLFAARWRARPIIRRGVGPGPITGDTLYAIHHYYMRVLCIIINARCSVRERTHRVYLYLRVETVKSSKEKASLHVPRCNTELRDEDSQP